MQILKVTDIQIHDSSKFQIKNYLAPLFPMFGFSTLQLLVAFKLNAFY